MNAWTKRVFFGCVHFPEQDKGAVKILKEFVKDFKPHEVVNLGDLMCVDQVSSYPTDQKMDLADEFTMAREFNADIGTTHMCLGNHEARLMRTGLVKPNLRKFYDPVRNLHLSEDHIHWKPYHNRKGIFQFGKLAALHGFSYNQYAARTTAEHYNCCVFAHTHRMQTFQPKHAREQHTGFNIGCLCKLDQDYMTDQPPRGWCHGFAFGYFKKGGTFSLYPVRLIGKEVVIEGKAYTR